MHRNLWASFCGEPCMNSCAGLWPNDTVDLAAVKQVSTSKPRGPPPRFSKLPSRTDQAGLDIHSWLCGTNSWNRCRRILQLQEGYGCAVASLRSPKNLPCCGHVISFKRKAQFYCGAAGEGVGQSIQSRDLQTSRFSQPELLTLRDSQRPIEGLVSIVCSQFLQ